MTDFYPFFWITIDTEMDIHSDVDPNGDQLDGVDVYGEYL